MLVFWCKCAQPNDQKQPNTHKKNEILSSFSIHFTTQKHEMLKLRLRISSRFHCQNKTNQTINTLNQHQMKKYCLSAKCFKSNLFQFYEIFLVVAICWN